MDIETTSTSRRPTKRRKTKAVRRVTEGDDDLADGIIVKNVIKDTLAGPIEERIEIPVWCNTTEPTSTAASSSLYTSRDPNKSPSENVDGDEGDFFQGPSVHDEDPQRTGRSQSYYMQEFVDRVHPLLKALLARETKPPISTCGRCSNDNLAIWRCRDCTAARIYCRACIREIHQDIPTHQIEAWNGKHFRRAELWEVGLYLLVPHHTVPNLCTALKFRQNVLAMFQRQNDMREQRTLKGDLNITQYDNDVNMEEGNHNTRGRDGRVNEFQNQNDLQEQRMLNRDLETGQNNKDLNIEEESHDGRGNSIRRVNEEDCDKFSYRGNDDHPEWNEHPMNINIYDDEGFAQFVDRIDNLFRETHDRSDSHFEEEEKDNAGNVEDDDIEEKLDVPMNYLPADMENIEAADANRHPQPSNTFQSTGPPRADALNNPYIRVVDINGIHNIGLVYCTCRGLESTHSDLMAAGLIPTSFVRYKTIFTKAVLDDFRLTNLECKASAYQYFQKIRRLTSPMSPNKVPNLYHELRRMSRLWRWMKKLKWAGFAHNHNFTIEPKPGELANFCPACPQPGINLPEAWSLDSQSWIYQRSFVADGNFKADHIRQKSTGNDVWLSEGGGMTAKREEYEEFLRTAINRLTKAPCENQFRAIELAMRLSKGCDINGIVAIACARHGCFAPNSVANLPAGEQQKNVDWGLLQSLKTTNYDPRQRILFIYDIVCQYIVYLQQRIGHLLPAGSLIDSAIGLFHVHGHKDQCFFRYATTFIPGAAVVAGEILESLWSTLNSVTPAMRTATLAHRAEIMDDHMTDSNHKKMLSMASSLVDRFNLAAGTYQCADVYYANLTEGLSNGNVQKWETEITEAEENRMSDRSVMDILGAKETCRDTAVTTAGSFHSVPSADSEWIQLALNIEEKQMELQGVVRRSSLEPTENNQKEVDRMRQVILSQFAILEHIQPKSISGEIFSDADDGLHEDKNFNDIDSLGDITLSSNFHSVSQSSAPSESVGSSNPAANHTPADRAIPAAASQSAVPISISHHADIVPPEKKSISLPSRWKSQNMIFRMMELDLRLTQAAKILSVLRDLIAEKSFQYSDVIRVAPRKGVRTRARSVIAKINDHISYQCSIYNHCRAAMVKLGADKNILSRFGVLQRRDISSSTALLNPNEPGSTTTHNLSWIWQTGRINEDPNSSGLHEFNRVHWLRARAQRQRWHEELILVGHEMDWTVRYYIYQSNMWESRKSNAEEMNDDGAAAYASRKIAMWMDMASDACSQFELVNPLFKSHSRQ